MALGRFVGAADQFLREGRNAIVLPDGDVLMAGSRSIPGPWLERLDHETEEIQTIASSQTPIILPALVALADGAVLIVGNDHRPPSVDARPTWRFDPETDELAEGPALPAVFTRPQAVLAADDSVFALGTPRNAHDPLAAPTFARLE